MERLGKHDGLLRGIEVGLQIKFGVADPALLRDLDKVEDLSSLEKVLDALQTAAGLDDLRRLLPAANGQTGQP
jgi:hypothetical protein